MVPRTARMSFGVDPSDGPDDEIYSTPLILRWIARCTSDWIRPGIDAKSRPVGSIMSGLPLRTFRARCGPAQNKLAQGYQAHRSIRLQYSVALAAMRPWQKTATSRAR